MGIKADNLTDDSNWFYMDAHQEESPGYYWFEGGRIKDAPVDFVKTFDEAMWLTAKPIDLPSFNRNPLRAKPNYVVPRHEHNLDEMIMVFKGQYTIEYGEGDEAGVRVVGPGEFFISRAGTPYTMTAGPEGVTYIETWPELGSLESTWYDVGWVPR